MNTKNSIKASPKAFKSFVGELKVSYGLKDRPKAKITCSADAAEQLRKCYESEGAPDIGLKESLWALFLNKANNVISWHKVSEGGLNGMVADPKTVFQAALLANAAALIIGHNHPSGSIKPSQADIAMTRKIKEAGAFLDLPLLDHIILSPWGEYYSFADEGAL